MISNNAGTSIITQCSSVNSSNYISSNNRVLPNCFISARKIVNDNAVAFQSPF